MSKSRGEGSIYESLLDALPKILIGLLIVIGTKLFLDLSRAIFREILEKIKVDPEDVLKVWTYIIWLLGYLLALSVIVENLGAFLMSLGLIGFGLTFAMRTPLSCFVAWIMIITHKPFRVNDRIKVGEVEGDVIDITLLYTVLREIRRGGSGPTGRLITFPNSRLLEESIVNYTLDFEYIWDKVSVSVTYESDRKLAEKIVKDCASEVIGETMKEGAEAMKNLSTRKHGAIGRGVYQYVRSTPIVHVSLKDSYFEVKVRYICKVKERRKVKTKISQLVLDKFKETQGIEIAYPHMEIITREKI
jgi:small-conductance mechanosensitive channel